jgi:transcriptional regulator with XRE-family HTH domain
MNIVERLKIIMTTNRLNAGTFADKIGIQRSNMSHVLTGRNKPSLDFIEKVLIAFPRVNAHWLIFGDLSNQNEPNSIESPIPSFKRLEANKNEASVANEMIGPLLNSKKGVTNKKIVKVITFYDDFTFDEYKTN